MIKDTKSAEWPDKPYRGLNYFRSQDRLLLAGRDNDVANCGELLSHPYTRVLLLHGATGCGKSSFLRAGLIPYMEEEGAFYLFLKIPDADDEALFIRCTEAPVDQIARQVFLFARHKFQLRTPRGMRELDLTPALLKTSSWEDYLAAARCKDGLLESLRNIAAIIPQTLVLIVDQAEEVLTLSPGNENFLNRSNFFNFLRAFQNLAFDVRIIIALRTEYFGRFIDAVHISSGTNFQHFFLSELTRDALVEAILRPTNNKAYGFIFENQLPVSIVNDILSARYSGPILPILQLVCLGLYEDSKSRNQTLITNTEYANKGGAEGQIIAHIASAIHSIYPKDEYFQDDIENLWKFLASFYTIQDDGTVASRTRGRDSAIDELEKFHLHISPSDMIAVLASPQSMILRSLRTVKADGKIARELTLGHDSIALALERWKTRETEDRIQDLTNQISKTRSGYINLSKDYSSTIRAALVNSIVTFMAFFLTIRDYADHSRIVKVIFSEMLHGNYSFENANALRLTTFFIFFVISPFVPFIFISQIMILRKARKISKRGDEGGGRGKRKNPNSIEPIQADPLLPYRKQRLSHGKMHSLSRTSLKKRRK